MDREIKKGFEKEVNKVLLIGIILITLLLVNIQGVVGESDNETLQQKLDNLTQYLTEQGYSWLINYSINYPKIEVYRENDNELIAVIDNVSSENWYKTYLSRGDASGGGAGWKDYFKLNEKAENEKPKNL